MDRAACILIYSQRSKHSRDVMEYLSNSDVDVPRLTGLAFLSVDNEETASRLSKKITKVPTLYVRYYNSPAPREQILEGSDAIIEWIDAVVAVSRKTPQTTTPDEHRLEEEQEECVGGVCPIRPSNNKKRTPIADEGIPKKKTILDLAAEIENARRIN